MDLNDVIDIVAEVFGVVILAPALAGLIFYYLVSAWIGLENRPIPRVGLTIVISGFLLYVGLGQSTGLYDPIVGYGYRDDVIVFSRPGARCTGGEIYLDEKTGSPLACKRGPLAARYFRESEYAQILSLAKELANDDNGLTEADRERVKELGKHLIRARRGQ